ncbi:MAG: hypothetical protein D3909_17200, partial [Candidatus Electrothrix sp. ATG1]|nr:hypothetical protein [Candidatus Electrothrix sp. ATG1]
MQNFYILFAQVFSSLQGLDDNLRETAAQKLLQLRIFGIWNRLDKRLKHPAINMIKNRLLVIGLTNKKQAIGLEGMASQPHHQVGLSVA